MVKAKTKLAVCHIKNCPYRQNTGNHFEFCPFKGCMFSKEEIKRAIKQEKAAEEAAKKKTEEEKNNGIS